MANQVVVIIAVALAALLIFVIFDSMRKRERHERKHKEAEKQPEEQQARPPQRRGVEIGTESNFEQLISSWPGTTVVFFWAPWCGYCKSAKPKFEAAASQIDGSKVQLVSVNCDEFKALGGKHAGSFPTMVKFQGSTQPSGKLVGDRSPEEMMAFMEM